MPISDTNGIGQKLGKVGCEGSISNPRLPKCHNLNILLPKAELQRVQDLFSH